MLWLIFTRYHLNFVTIKMFWTKKNNNTTTKQKQIKHKTPCRGRGLSQGTVAPKADAIAIALRRRRYLLNLI